jgi:octaprenyl-diphosphate synthase
MSTLYAFPRQKELAPEKDIRLNQISEPVSEDLVSVDRHINSQIASDVGLIREMGAYLIMAGGKRLRPITLLLATKVLNYRGTDHITLAAVIELIHTATLMHDDVVDNSGLRRGRRTGNAVWGNAASILVGDFIYSRCFEMMVTVNRMRVMEIMASTTNAIAEGEVMQLLHLNSPDIGENEYFGMIERKTARLFRSSTKLAAVLAGVDESTEGALAAYGLNLGIAFQISDDLLDYGPASPNLGKNPGDDLAEGKCTLPLIHALKNGTKKDKRLLRSAIENGDRGKIQEIREIIKSTGSIEYTSRRAREYAAAAKSQLNKLPESIFLSSLRNLADFSVSRLH